MIFIWTKTGHARELKVGSQVRGLCIKGRRPDLLLLSNRESGTIKDERRLGEEYANKLEKALHGTSPHSAQIIFYDER